VPEDDRTPRTSLLDEQAAERRAHVRHDLLYPIKLASLRPLELSPDLRHFVGVLGELERPAEGRGRARVVALLALSPREGEPRGRTARVDLERLVRRREGFVEL